MLREKLFMYRQINFTVMVLLLLFLLAIPKQINAIAKSEGSYLLTAPVEAIDPMRAVYFNSPEHRWLSAQNTYDTLIDAVKNGDVEAAKILIEAGADVNSKDDKGMTVLMSAAEYRQAEIVEALIEAGADVSAKNSDGMTALMLGVANAEVVRTLIEAGADVDAKNNYGGTALMSAVMDAEIVKALIEAGAEVNAKNDKGITALMSAAKTGQAETVKVLIEAGADVNAKNTEGMTALMVTEWKAEVVKALAESGAELNTQHEFGDTTLMIAIRKGQTEIAKVLIEEGADVNVKNDGGWTALMDAAMSRHTEIVKALTEAGADVHAKTTDSITALMKAAEFGRAETVKLLIEAGADVNAKNTYGKTALYAAQLNSTQDSKEIVDLLKAAGAKEYEDDQKYPQDVPEEEVAKMDCRYGTIDFGFEPVKGEIDKSVTKKIGPYGGCLQVTLSDGTMFILLVPLGALSKNAEITLALVHASDYPHPGEIMGIGDFGIDFKPHELHFSIPAILKIQYPDSVAEAAAKGLYVSTYEAEKELRVYRFGPEPPFDTDMMYRPIRILKGDMENNIMIVDVESSGTFFILWQLI